jgi:hypothetical protein
LKQFQWWKVEDEQVFDTHHFIKEKEKEKSEKKKKEKKGGVCV